MTIKQTEFVNSYGEKYVLEYDTRTEKATLKGDETDWEKISVVDGKVNQKVFLLSALETKLLSQAWEEVTGRFPFTCDIEQNLLMKNRRSLDLPFTKEEYEIMIAEEKDYQGNSQQWVKIYQYWIEHPLAHFLHLPNQSSLESKCVDDNPFLCMACGLVEAEERAHIFPVNRGGSNRLSNIHALCYYCHQASEGLSGYAYWLFIEQRRPIDRILQEFNHPYGSKKKKKNPQNLGLYHSNMLKFFLEARTENDKERSDWFLFTGEHDTDQLPFEMWQEILLEDEEE
jgi:hypothetical protein